MQCSVLSNGLRIVSERVDSVRSVSIGLWVRTGSGNESARLNGISHLAEHMLFKGTRKRSTRQIAQRMESVGGYLNAFTGKEYTCYYARCLDNHLDRAIELIADMVMNPSLAEKELAKEKDVIFEEMRMYRDAPEDHIYDFFEAVLYKGHAFARPIIGSEKSLREIGQPELAAYVKREYIPQRIVVAAAGNLEHEKVLRSVGKYMGEWSATGYRSTKRSIPGYTPGRITIRKTGEQAHLVWGTRTRGLKEDNRTAMVVFNTLLGGGMSSVLNQSIRERYGYCYNIYSFLNVHSTAGDFGVYAGVDPSKVGITEALIVRCIEKLAAGRIPKSALSQAKNQVSGSLVLGLESMSGRMMRIGREEIYFRNHMSFDEMIERVNSVSADDIKRAAVSILEGRQPSMVTIIPEGVS